jgi:hypothetical protein
VWVCFGYIFLSFEAESVGVVWLYFPLFRGGKCGCVLVLFSLFSSLLRRKVWVCFGYIFIIFLSFEAESVGAF